jgi:hypothetical protein
MDVSQIIVLISLLLFAPALLFILSLYTKDLDSSTIQTSPIIGPLSKLFTSGTIATNPLKGLAEGIGGIFSTLPDSLVIGSLIMATILQSLPLFGIFIALIELMLGRVLIGKAISVISPEFSLSKSSEKCKGMSGIKYATINSVSAAAADKFKVVFPSETMFILGGLAAYIMSNVIEFRDEMVALGPETEARMYLIAALIGIGLIAFITHQIAYSCSSTGSLILSGFIAILAGLLISFQNKVFMGRESINVLGLPFLDDRVSTGAPLYVCDPRK